MSDLSEVLPFWFEEISPQQWFMGGSSFDALLLERFSGLYADMCAGPDPEIADGERTLLAAILVFDQFPRNMFRGRAQAFASDARALGLARTLVEAGLDEPLTPRQRLFAWLPFEHSEDMDDQEQSVRLFGSLPATERTGELQHTLDYARRHHGTIARFGRFPGRNAALGRQNTPEEHDFLQEHPEGF